MSSSASASNGTTPRLGGGPRLLLVEDDADTRDLMGLLLSGEGFAVDTAASAAEGLALMRARPYDIVLTDYDMPGGTGTDMLREADRGGLLGGAAPLIVTAHPEPAELPGVAIIRKPVDVAHLVSILRSLAANAAAAADPAPREGPAPRPA